MKAALLLIFTALLCGCEQPAFDAGPNRQIEIEARLARIEKTLEELVAIERARDSQKIYEQEALERRKRLEAEVARDLANQNFNRAMGQPAGSTNRVFR